MKTDEAPSTFTLSAVVSPSKQLWSCKPKHWATHPHKSAALTYNCSSVWPCLLRAVPILRRYVVHALKSRGVDTPKQPPVAAVLHSLAYPDEDGSWAAWREDMPWLSAYFVAGPWGALCMYLRIAAAEL